MFDGFHYTHCTIRSLTIILGICHAICESNGHFHSYDSNPSFTRIFASGGKDWSDGKDSSRIYMNDSGLVTGWTGEDTMLWTIRPVAGAT